MSAPLVSPALASFVDEELLRAPMLFDQTVDSTLIAMRKATDAMGPAQRAATADLVQALKRHQPRLAEYFLHSVRRQVDVELGRRAPEAPAPAPPPKVNALALVDEEEVALDVELSHTIDAIRTTAEYELRELQTYLSALVGDPDVARDYNPFRAETLARALWDAAHALPMSRGHQVAFLRHAGAALAQRLRVSYAAASSRLEQQGVEPAAYRTVILPPGSRRERLHDTTYAPELTDIRAALGPSRPPAASAAATAGRDDRREPRHEVARDAQAVDRQAVELVSRLFEAMIADERVPADVSLLISRLQGPAMRLTLRDGSLLDQSTHPLWTFIDRFTYEAEMVPDAADPDRALLLKTAAATIDQLANEPEQRNSVYSWALETLENFLRRRLARRMTAAAAQIGTLQELEHKLMTGHAVPSTMHGTLDVQQLDTVPADLVGDPRRTPSSPDDDAHWLTQLRGGAWVRMFLGGQWVHAQLLWAGERQEIWLLGDGASDITWAIRRGALLLMHRQGLLKTLRQRSIVGSAAARVQEKLTAETAA